MGWDSDLYMIYYFTEYNTEYDTPTSGYVNDIGSSGTGVYTESLLPTLSAEGMVFEGWYTTETYDEGTKVSVGDSYSVSTTTKRLFLYAKWSVVTVSSLLTNLADELRTLTNTTDKMGLSVMAGHVSDANTEVDEQSAVVDELMAALQGKSVPGGGSTPTYETCDVTLIAGDNASSTEPIGLVYYTLIDGVPTMKSLYLSSAVVLPNLPELQPMKCIIGSDLCIGYPTVSSISWNHRVTGSIECSDDSDYTQVGMTLGKIFTVNGSGSITYDC